MSRFRLSVIYLGHVQGVGFRYAVKSLVAGFEVTGTIRNLPDGSVELLAEGEKGELEEFKTAILESGLGPMIRETREKWSPAQGGFRGFEIVS